jgi:hypothetical protein
VLKNKKRQSNHQGPSINELKNLLKNQINSFVLKAENEDFLTDLNCIDQTLSLIDDDKDPIVFSMVGGYVKEFVTSFLILYFGTKDLDKSLKAHSMIKALTKYIVLLDKHYDEKSYEYKARADAIFEHLMKNATGYVRYAIKHQMATLWAIASYEIKLKERMLNKEIFEKCEIRYHIMQKSSDTVLYSIILDKYADSFNPNILQLLHYNQALLDIQDDLKDVEEDIMNRDLNIFLMSSGSKLSIVDVFSNRISSDKVIKESTTTVLSIISDLESCIEGISVPQEFSFMKSLSRYYIKTLRKSLKEFNE